jgi:sugar phosphate isomerase/epimerase
MNKLHCGMPTLIELSSLEETAALCRELGLDFIELNMNLPQYADLRETKQLAEVADKYNLYYTVHLDGFLNPCDFNQTIAKAYTDIVLQTVEAAKALHIPLLNMHLAVGDKITLPEQKVYLFEKYNDIWLRNLRKFRDTVTDAVGNADIKICVENTGGGFDPNVFTHQGLLTLLESTAFAITYDIGHNAKRDLPNEAAYIENSSKLYHMHCHDVLDGHDHLPLGAGELDIPRYLDLAREHECRVLLETKTVAGLKQSVAWLKERGIIFDRRK